MATALAFDQFDALLVDGKVVQGFEDNLRHW
jgi:hypothetical protein